MRWYGAYYYSKCILHRLQGTFCLVQAVVVSMFHLKFTQSKGPQISLSVLLSTGVCSLTVP